MKFSAIILAGGSSGRFGKNKLLLPLGEKTVLGTTIDKWLIPEIDEILLVTGAFHDEIIRQAFPAIVRIVKNPQFDQGMSHSIRCGLENLDPSTDGVFIIPADIPLFKQETLYLMTQKFGQKKIIIPTYENKKGHPVLIDREIVESCLANHSEKILYDTIQKHSNDVELLAVNDPGIVMDLDTIEDYNRMKKINEGFYP